MFGYRTMSSEAQLFEALNLFLIMLKNTKISNNTNIRLKILQNTQKSH
jgi:hypothetical protein